MKVWVTKYWSTNGVYQAEVKRTKSGPDRYVYTTERFSQQFVLGRDAFEDKEEARAWVDKDRARKIKSLEKRITKLKAIHF